MTYTSAGQAGSLIAIRKVRTSPSREIDAWDGAYGQLLGPLRQLKNQLEARIDGTVQP